MVSIPSVGGALSAAFGGGGGQDKLDDIYKPLPEKWFETQPYGFALYDRNVTTANPTAGSAGAQVFYLPISPQNIQVVTNFATNIVSTLYGVVEEHSAVKFYDITISGTTGIAPTFVDEKQNQASNPIGNALNSLTGNSSQPDSYRSSGRSAFDNSPLLDLGGFLPEVTNVVNQVADFVSEADNLLNGGVKDTTGIDPTKSGYAAFHNFYRFLLKYKKDAAGIGAAGNQQRISNTALQFLNYKDGIKYDCAIQTFTLTRSAENPFLYNYSIKMRCYNLRNVSASGAPESTNQAAKLGLDGVGNSIFSQAAGLASSAGALVSGFL